MVCKTNTVWHVIDTWWLMHNICLFCTKNKFFWSLSSTLIPKQDLTRVWDMTTTLNELTILATHSVCSWNTRQWKRTIFGLQISTDLRTRGSWKGSSESWDQCFIEKDRTCDGYWEIWYANLIDEFIRPPSRHTGCPNNLVKHYSGCVHRVVALWH